MWLINAQNNYGSPMAQDPRPIVQSPSQSSESPSVSLSPSLSQQMNLDPLSSDPVGPDSFAGLGVLEGKLLVIIIDEWLLTDSD